VTELDLIERSKFEAKRRFILAKARIAHLTREQHHYRDWPPWLIEQRFQQANENKTKKQDSVSEHSAGSPAGE